MAQTELFPGIHHGFARGYIYEPEFLSSAEEDALVRNLAHLPFAHAQYKGFLANRRIVSYGGRYDFSAQRLEQAEPIPPFLQPLRAHVALWASCRPDDLTHALIAEYAPGTQLGWHRDVPNFELVMGISLVGACRMRFRPYPPQPRTKSIAVTLEPRSIYILREDARWHWQHCVPAVPTLRYSITFRTLRA
jgi:alkylated DNA repair dioxygenase AlkB